MSSQLMTLAQHSMSASSARWELAAGEALRLPIGPGARKLLVTEGQLWLTRSGTLDAPSEDVWLEAGESLPLDDGSVWVVEGWSQASFQLLVPPQACAAYRARHEGSEGRERVARFSVSAWKQRASAWLMPALA